MKQVTADSTFDPQKAEWGTIYWVEQSYVTTPKDQTTAYVDYWWLTNEDGRVGLYNGTSPQANKDERVADLVMKNIAGATGRVLIPVAFVPTQR